MTHTIHLTIGAVVLSAGLAACTPGHASAVDQSGTAIPVQTEDVRSRPLVPRITATGVLNGKEEVALSFKIGGIIARITVDEGKHVRAGQLLAELAPTEIASEVAKAEQGRRKAQRDLERVRRLHDDSVATLEQLQDATTALEVADQNLRIAEFNQQHAVIRAPSNGLVLRRLAEPGQMVASSAPVVVVRASGRGLVFRVGLADRDVVRLRAGDDAQVRFDALAGDVFRGRVTQIASAASPGSGTYDVEIALDSHAAALSSGLIGRAEIVARASATYPVVPVEALIEAEGDSAVLFVVPPNAMRAVRRVVRIASIDGAQVAIASGIAAGERIIVRGAAYVDDGSRVTIVAGGQAAGGIGR